MKPMTDTKVRRIRPKVSCTVDAANLEWFDAFRGGTSRSRAFDAVLGAFRSYVAEVAEIVTDPRVDLVRRAEDLLEAAKSGRPADPADVAVVVSALLEKMKEVAE